MDKIIKLAWQVPFGEFYLKIDPLSVIFLAAIFVMVFCAGIYGIGYMRAYRGSRALVGHAIFYIMLAVSFFLLVLAGNVIMFLAAWEIMSISTYFLIVFNSEKASTRKAGVLYLAAAHCGTFLLFIMFFLMSAAAGSTDFDVISGTVFSPALAGTIFLLAVAGFGVKAGFLPMHIWLPHAHPAAPSHVSALLSGIAIKTGIYGICRVLWMIKHLPEWCGYVLIAVGIVSGIMGVLYALGQHEIKKLLAYHSIENIGIISIGMGVGLLGNSYNAPHVAVLGFSGALLHVVNHAIFKGLLFLNAGSVIQRTHTGELDMLGGLAKTMPLVSVLFLVGALSISGLPLFNGFISEFFIYCGLFKGLLCLPLQGVVLCALGILSLALMGALALACFAKVYGTVFLGTPRSSLTADNSKTSNWMLFPMILLACLCLWIGLAPGVMSAFTFSGGQYLSRIEMSTLYLDNLMPSLSAIISAVFILIVLVLGLILLRRRLLGRDPMPVRETWNCGFTVSSPKFQYTSASFARAIVDCFKGVLLARRHGGEVSGEFPQKAHVSSCVHDFSEDHIFKRIFVRLLDISNKIDKKRIRYTQMYLMYIFIFLIFLLMWKIR